MKAIASIFLVLIVLLNSSMKTAAVLNYQLNKDFVAATFCVNKSKPQLHCNGKCYLAKKIKAQEDQERKLPSILKGAEEVILYFSAFRIAFTAPVQLTRCVLNSLIVVSHYTNPVSSIFQPPQ